MKKLAILSALLIGGVAHAQNLPNLPGLLNDVPSMAQKSALPAHSPQYDPCQDSNTYSLDPNRPNANGCVHTKAAPPVVAHKTTI